MLRVEEVVNSTKRCATESKITLNAPSHKVQRDYYKDIEKVMQRTAYKQFLNLIKEENHETLKPL